MTIVLGKWSIAAIVTIAAWIWFVARGSQSHGDYDFGPAIIGFVLLVGTVALWIGLLVGAAL